MIEAEYIKLFVARTKEQSRICSDKTELQVCPDDLKLWENSSVRIQDALPYLNAAERELILTGTCGKCFDEMTGVFK